MDSMLMSLLAQRLGHADESYSEDEDDASSGSSSSSSGDDEFSNPAIPPFSWSKCPNRSNAFHQCSRLCKQVQRLGRVPDHVPVGSMPYRGVEEEKEKAKEDRKGRLLRKDMGQLLSSERLCDVTFLVGSKGQEESIGAHRVLLSARSPVFAAMLFSGFAESESQSIRVPDISPDVFRLMLRAIYTDKADLDDEVIVPCLFAASKYQIAPFLQLCVKYMSRNLTVENALVLYEATEKLEESKSTQRFIEENAEDILAAASFAHMKESTLLHLFRGDSVRLDASEIHVFEAAVRWARAQHKQQQQQQPQDEVCTTGGVEVGAEAASKEQKKAVETTATAAASIWGAAAQGGPDGATLRHILRNLLPYIRFPLMSEKDLCFSVQPTGILTSTELVQLYVHLSTKGSAFSWDNVSASATTAAAAAAADSSMLFDSSTLEASWQCSTCFSINERGVNCSCGAVCPRHMVKKPAKSQGKAKVHANSGVSIDFPERAATQTAEKQYRRVAGFIAEYRNSNGVPPAPKILPRWHIAGTGGTGSSSSNSSSSSSSTGGLGLGFTSLGRVSSWS